uniref:Fibronectin type-III domain-containing protein n=1 Tax=Schistocephalus solidus TaxID=70667 RepID=A0A0V0J904_SCHSO
MRALRLPSGSSTVSGPAVNALRRSHDRFAGLATSPSPILTSYKLRVTLNHIREMPVRIQGECRRLSSGFLHYDQCESACDIGLTYNECARQCQSGEIPEGWACLTGCRNLDRALKHRPGDCPNVFPDGSLAFQDPNETSTPEAGHWLPVVSDDGPAGISMCTIDQTCPEELKCCNEHCVRPEFGKSVPDLVAVPQIVEEGKPRAFELSWNAGMSERDALMEPVIYLLQVRTYFGPEFDPMQASEWKTLTTTTIPGARLSDPDIGWWYQYRIAAVSPQGSRGFGDSSPPVRMTTQLPQPASPPLQLTDDIWRLHADGSVQVRLQWQPPMTASIPITEYHVSWATEENDLTPHGIYTKDSKPFRHIVPGSQTFYVLEDLKLNLTYRIQMWAVCAWGPENLVSKPVTHFIRTPNVPKRDIFLTGENKLFSASRGRNMVQVGAGLNRNDLLSSQADDETIHEATETFNCECEGSRRSNNQQSRLFITSGFRSIRVDHHSAPDDTGGFSIRFANDPGVFDGQFLKTFLTINEFLEPSGRNQIRADEHISPRLLQLKWKPLACIETSAQVSKTFIPLKVSRANIAGKSSAGSYFTAEQSRFVVMEPVSTSALAPTRLIRSGRVEISPLQLNCHYSVFVVPDTEAAAQNLNKVVNDGGAGVPNSRSTRPPISAIQIGCLCTPACFDDQSLPWASHFSCINEDSQHIPPPTELEHRLVSDKKITYNISWRPSVLRPIQTTRMPRSHPGNSEDQTETPFYRVSWGPSLDSHLNLRTIQRMADRQPRLNPTIAETKVLRSGKTSLLLDSLMPGTVYIVTVQTLLFRGSRQEAFRSPQIPSGTSAASHGQDHIRAMPGRQLRHNSNSPASLQVSEEAFVYIQTPSLSEGRLGSLCNAAASLPLPIWNLSFLFPLITSLVQVLLTSESCVQ